MTKWAEFVKKLMRGEQQLAIAERAGVNQGTISKWVRGVETPKSPAVVAHFAQAMDGNVLEGFVAAGFLSPEDAGMPPAPAVSFAELVDADPDLSPEAKVHIKNQYGLLKAASAHARTVLLREQIERSETMDPETKAQLLATLNDQMHGLGRVEEVAQAESRASIQSAFSSGKSATVLAQAEPRPDVTYPVAAAEDAEHPAGAPEEDFA